MQKCFNQYYLTKQITSKSSGSVYLAHPNNLTSQQVILKVFNAASFTSDQQSQNFLQQVKRISELKHPSIVPILDFGIEQGQPYVAREYLGSDSLRQQMDCLSPRGMDLQDALKIISLVGRALRYAHQHQILHGNLKPENIFLTSNNEVLISDFGITSFINMMKLQNQSDWQTTGYLAPEQLVGSITHKSDQYALGCLTYELLTGHAPSSAQSFSPIVSLPLDEGELTYPIEEETEIACQNSQCPDYGKVGDDNVRKFGKTRKGMQRWQCKTCRTTWSFCSPKTEFQTGTFSFSNLSHNMPDMIENAVFKAMAKNPTERYADIFIFLNTLQIVSSLPTFSLTSSPEVPITATIHEHGKQIPTNCYVSRPLKTSNLETSLPDKASVTSHRDAHLPNKSIGSSKPETHPPNQVSVMSNLDVHLPSKTPIPLLGSHLPSSNHIETFPEGRHAQFNKPLAPTFWLAFALSGFILLLGTLAFYYIAPIASPPASPKLMTQIVITQSSAKITSTPQIQSSRKTTFSPPKYSSTWEPPNSTNSTTLPSRQVTPTSTVQPSMQRCNNPFMFQPYNCPHR